MKNSTLKQSNPKRLVLKKGSRFTDAGFGYTVYEDYDSTKDQELCVFNEFFQVIIGFTFESMSQAIKMGKIVFLEDNVGELSEGTFASDKSAYVSNSDVNVATTINSNEIDLIKENVPLEMHGGLSNPPVNKDFEKKIKDSCMKLENISHDKITEFGGVVRTKAYPDESFQSYIQRYAIKNEAGLTDVVNKYLSPEVMHVSTKSNLNYLKIDFLMSGINILFESEEQFNRTLLAQYDEKFISEKDSISEKMFFYRTSFSKYCPSCLEEAVYHRLRWDVNFYCVCLKHQVYLEDYCPSCLSRVWVGNIVKGLCECGYKLSRTKKCYPNDFVMNAQKNLQTALVSTIDAFDTPASTVTQKQYFNLFKILSNACETSLGQLNAFSLTGLNLTELRKSKGYLPNTSKSSAAISSIVYHIIKDPSLYADDLYKLLSKSCIWREELSSNIFGACYMNKYLAKKAEYEVEKANKDELNAIEAAEFLGIKPFEVKSLCSNEVLNGKKLLYHNDWSIHRTDLKKFLSSIQKMAHFTSDGSTSLISLSDAASVVFQRKTQIDYCKLIKFIQEGKVKLFKHNSAETLSSLFILKLDLEKLLTNPQQFLFGYTLEEAAEILNKSLSWLKVNIIRGIFTPIEAMQGLLYGGKKLYICPKQIEEYLFLKDVH